MTARTAEILAEIGDRMREALIGRTAGSLVVRDVEVDLVEDLTEAMVWQARLFLDVPPSGSWPVDDTLQLKQEARTTTDDIAAQYDAQSEGMTSILITAQNAPEEDVAPPDEPEPEERTDVKSDVENPA